MKKLLITILFGLLASLPGAAQSQSFQFFYISQDRGTPVNDLCDRMKYVYETAYYDSEYAVIFYLPNYDESMTVVMNLQGDNRDSFDSLLAELRLKSYHEISADYDYEKIINLINEYDFIGENGERRYSSVEVIWYVNPDFWRMGYNEKLIASLYFNLELDKYPDYVNMQIWHAKGDGLDQIVEPDKPFGNKNLCNDYDFMLLSY